MGSRRKGRWKSGGLDDQLYAGSFNCIAGLDEAGRGPWAGPVVAAAVIFPRGLTHPEIKDSKLLNSRKREELAGWIKENALSWALGIVGPEEIDRMNILKASLLAMAYAFGQLEPVPDCILIDGAHKIPLEFLKDEGRAQKHVRFDSRVPSLEFILEKPNAKPKTGSTSFRIPFQQPIKKGDRLCLSIAAASILAKVVRDRIMTEYDSLYPEYGFAQHKGYGSRLHLAALNCHGPSPIHRRSFRPVRESSTEDPSREALSGQLKLLTDDG
jgi:ribonuclease HII